MPGDSTGRLIVVVKIIDDERFGTIEKSEEIDWEAPLVIEVKPSRGKGDRDAPLWFVMLTPLHVAVSSFSLHNRKRFR